MSYCILVEDDEIVLAVYGPFRSPERAYKAAEKISGNYARGGDFDTTVTVREMEKPR